MSDLLEKKNHYNYLYSFYGQILTAKQQSIFESYYVYDYSLSEIASELSISRNAVFDTLKVVEASLDNMESKLNLGSKMNELKNVLNEYEEKAPELTIKVREIMDL